MSSEHPHSENRGQASDGVIRTPLFGYAPAYKIELKGITNEQYNHYAHLFETARDLAEAKITSYNNMEARNMALGEAGRAEDYHETSAWIRLQLRNLLRDFREQILVLFEKAQKGEIFDV